MERNFEHLGENFDVAATIRKDRARFIANMTGRMQSQDFRKKTREEQAKELGHVWDKCNEIHEANQKEAQGDAPAAAEEQPATEPKNEANTGKNKPAK